MATTFHTQTRTIELTLVVAEQFVFFACTGYFLVFTIYNQGTNIMLTTVDLHVKLFETPDTMTHGVGTKLQGVCTIETWSIA